MGLGVRQYERALWVRRAGGRLTADQVADDGGIA